MVIMKDLLRVQYDTYEYKSFRVITPAHVFICYCNNEMQICTICCLKLPQALHSQGVFNIWGGGGGGGVVPNIITFPLQFMELSFIFISYNVWSQNQKKSIPI